ncbi:MAG: hypothetical protein AB8C40_10495 [Gammaproteobacteria bacterium]
MDRKLSFKFIVALILVGLGFTGYAFLSTLSVTDKQKNSAWAACDLSSMLPGTIKECGYGYVYKRTDQDKKLINKFVHLLADPDQKESVQPDNAKNIWRSANKDYFVFYPWSPHRGCGVFFNNAVSNIQPNLGIPEDEAIKSLPYFKENCESRIWDMSGRLYNRKQYPPEYNLTVPKVEWYSDSKVYVHAP